MPSVITKKPRYDVYFVMLLVSLIAILIGCLFLFLEIREYGGWGAWNGSPLSSVTPGFGESFSRYLC